MLFTTVKYVSLLYNIWDHLKVTLNICFHISFLGDDSEITISQLLDFWTGANRPLPCGFHKDFIIDFYTPETGVYRLPSASTCALTLYLPRGIEEPEVLSEMMRRALTECQGFGFI